VDGLGQDAFTKAHRGIPLAFVPMQLMFLDWWVVAASTELPPF
jgi:hypothetical protein